MFSKYHLNELEMPVSACDNWPHKDLRSATMSYWKLHPVCAAGKKLIGHVRCGNRVWTNRNVHAAGSAWHPELGGEDIYGPIQ